MIEKIIIWDDKNKTPTKSNNIIHWCGYKNISKFQSVPSYLEENSVRLRLKYLSYIHDLGVAKINNKRLVDHLEIENGFSFWWMTLLAEKSYLKSPRIFDCLRLLALEEMVEKIKPLRIDLISKDRPLAEAIEILCKKKISFIWIKIPNIYSLNIRLIWDYMPSSLQGIIYLIQHLIKRKNLNVVKPSNWFPGKIQFLFFLVLFTLTLNCLRRGNFSQDSGKFFLKRYMNQEKD